MIVLEPAAMLGLPSIASAPVNVAFTVATDTGSIAVGLKITFALLGCTLMLKSSSVQEVKAAPTTNEETTNETPVTNDEATNNEPIATKRVSGLLIR